MTFKSTPNLGQVLCRMRLHTTALLIGLVAAAGSLPCAASGGQSGADRKATVASEILPVLSVFPAIAPVGTKRLLQIGQVSNCTGGYTPRLDTSRLQTERLILVLADPFVVITLGFSCTSSLHFSEFEVDVGNLAGDFVVRLEFPPGLNNRVQPPQITTFRAFTAAPKAVFDVNGMWYDPATNGSGLALHHSRDTDTAFGTWYMYDVYGNPWWQSLQIAYWTDEGRVLQGYLLPAYLRRYRCGVASIGQSICPAEAFAVFPGSNLGAAERQLVRITFQSATTARAEVRAETGVLLFTSELRKIAF